MVTVATTLSMPLFYPVLPVVPTIINIVWVADSKFRVQIFGDIAEWIRTVAGELRAISAI